MDMIRLGPDQDRQDDIQDMSKPPAFDLMSLISSDTKKQEQDPLGGQSKPSAMSIIQSLFR